MGGIELVVEDVLDRLKPIVERTAQDFEQRFRALVELFERREDPHALKRLLRESLRLGRSVELKVLDEVGRRREMYLLIPSTSEHFFKYLEEIYTLDLDPVGKESEEALARAVAKTLEPILPGDIARVADVKKIAADIAKEIMQKPIFRIAVEAFKRSASGTFSEILRSYSNAISLNRLAMEIFLDKYGEKLGLGKRSNP